ncbi:hypothetical protein [Rhizobium leguminosarum]|uniref:hypothetical protein n=1 Tax=Rhizobium leguminosarum TaxID=384 RepID=UPI001AE811BB|nr:hypothetical protein [Rhizobium leguminosarum]MBP2446980.1 hypothetical protein [Rhizobium leguminosarum]
MDKDDELDGLSEAAVSRRLMADIDELIVEHELYCNSVSRTLHEAIDLALGEAAGRTTRPFDEDFRHTLSNAIYLPILGGEVLRNGERLPSPTYKVSTLERAIRNGHLEGQKESNKWTVTIQALRAWLALGGLSEPTRAARAPRTEAAVAARDKERKTGATMSAMSILDAALLNAKKQKK